MRRRAGLFFAGALVLCLLLQFSFPQLIGTDGFFHARFAQTPLGPMPWMPQSVFSDGWVDHQLLFHLLMWPFVALFPGVVGAKLATATFCALAATSGYLLLERLKAPRAALLAALPFGISWLFWLRLSMPRTQSLSLALLIGIIWTLMERRWWALFGLCWLYLWTYHVSLLALPLAGLWAALQVALASDRGAALRRDGRAPLIAAAGLLAGLLIHPHSPRTFHFVWQHVFLKVLNTQDLPVGGEWTDGGLAILTGPGLGGLLALVAAGLCLARWGRSEPDHARRNETLFLWLAAAGATGACLVGSKFVEYSTPLSVCALGLALRHAPAHAFESARRRPWLRPASALLCGLLVLSSAARIRAEVMLEEPDPQRLAGVMEFARSHIEPDTIVYHFSWNDLPELMFHGPEFRYVVGLDPHFLALHDPDLWTLYQRISEGWGSNPSRPIRQRFQADYAVLVLPWPGAEQLLGADDGLTELYRDPHAILYRVR